MKKIILSAIAAAFSLSACDVSVENPNSRVADTFWKNEADAQYGINAVYSMFQKPDTYSRWLWFRFDLTSDEGFSVSPWAELCEWTNFRYYNYNFAEGNVGSYNACYRGIFRANQVLANVPNIEFSSANAANKENILAQAYFLRGLWYYNLALLWGSDNPSLAIVLEPSTPGMQPEGHTRNEIYAQAIGDFTEAITMNIPESWDAANKGRATKWAALAFRAKANMQMGKFAEALPDLQNIIDNGGFDLMPDYIDNFTADKENNIESVFEIQFSDVNPASQSDGDFAVNPLLGLNRGQFFGPPGRGWTDGELRPWLVTEFKKEKDLDDEFDIRLKYSVLYKGMDQDFADNNMVFGVNVTNDWDTRNWGNRVYFRKYARIWLPADDYANPINVRLIRYADILLLHAECLAETGGSLTTAVADVDRVRARANMPALSVNHPEAAANADAFLKRLQMERVMELATEGHRWEDLKRWGLLDTQAGIDEIKTRDADFNNFVIGRHNVLPIPSNEVNNNPNIKQNPNY